MDQCWFSPLSRYEHYCGIGRRRKLEGWEAQDQIAYLCQGEGFLDTDSGRRYGSIGHFVGCPLNQASPTSQVVAWACVKCQVSLNIWGFCQLRLNARNTDNQTQICELQLHTYTVLLRDVCQDQDLIMRWRVGWRLKAWALHPQQSISYIKLLLKGCIQLKALVIFLKNRISKKNNCYSLKDENSLCLLLVVGSYAGVGFDTVFFCFITRQNAIMTVDSMFSELVTLARNGSK